MMKRISFILPSSGSVPIGGFKIVYEYANRLSECGCKVNIIHLHKKNITSNPLKKFFNYFGYILKSNFEVYTPDSWFPINKEINCFFIPYVADKYIDDADFIFATEYTTAKPVFGLSASKGKKLYFIQSLETWLGKEEDVVSTWKLPIRKIVISKWLLDYAKKINEDAVYIPNGLDFEKFGLDIPIHSRHPMNILMLFHMDKVKGSKFGLEALIKLKYSLPELNVTLFSVYQRPDNIPDWINYVYRPSQTSLRELYNKSSIFVSPSIFEGFPLPPAEAMMCGCAVVATDIGGHREYCEDYKTALLVPIKSSDKLYDKILELITNNVLRIDIGNRANQYIKRFTWEKSIQQMISVIEN